MGNLKLFSEKNKDELNEIMNSFKIEEPVKPQYKNCGVLIFSAFVFMVTLLVIIRVYCIFIKDNHLCNNILITTLLLVLFGVAVIYAIIQFVQKNNILMKEQYEKDCEIYDFYKRALFEKVLNSVGEAYKNAAAEKNKKEKEKEKEKENKPAN